MNSSPLHDADQVVHTAWQHYAAACGDQRHLASLEEVSAHVSTNRVFRVVFSDHSSLVAKVSSYGSYFLFAEDHDRLARCTSLLRHTRWAGFLADVLSIDKRPYTWYDGRCWCAFYGEVQRAESLPRILPPADVVGLAHEIARFHHACGEIAPALPAVSNSVKGDAIHLFDQLTNPFAPRNFGLPPEDIGVLARFTHDLLLHLESVHYDEWKKIPILVDWNLGNFSVTRDEGNVRLFSRWDYDWFRIESRLLDFYFLSRVSSSTGDRTSFTYSPHTLTEPRFVEFVRAYHEVNPLTRRDIEFLPYAYRIFILNYVIREGARFFRDDLCNQFRRDAAHGYLESSTRLDLKPLLEVVGD
ncbi:MAG: hypothetical protein ACO3D1_00040 [Ilumatobacteraceae bacterium]|nr:hypothetical protein [Actinomycetota bacterium]NCW91095.1 hypothetical protein [Acidimicrobiia bacterium]NCV09566.1 hypothetical protein [Actinomycetota bacterium]NCX18086.1 hypothetical protein [Acidimicrobiia bacterium]NCX31290.1 hypothetical protein [Actinomycetota bacterium]